VMVATIQSNLEISKRILSPDDIRAACEIYPSAEDPHVCAYDMPAEGCGCSAAPTPGGHFTIAPLPAGDIRLEIQHPDYPTSIQPATPGKYANLTVPFPGGIAGEVKAKTTGAAVARGRLEAIGPGGAKASADVRRDGTFRLLRLVPGRWRLTIVSTGFRSAEQELEVPASSNLGEASIRGLRVELEGS